MSDVVPMQVTVQHWLDMTKVVTAARAATDGSIPCHPVECVHPSCDLIRAIRFLDQHPSRRPIDLTP